MGERLIPSWTDLARRLASLRGNVIPKYIYRIKYWLYVKSGLKKRDGDNWWRGACHANTCADVRTGMIEMKDWEPWKEDPQFLYLQALHARVEWTRHMRPEWTWKQANARVTNPKW